MKMGRCSTRTTSASTPACTSFRATVVPPQPPPITTTRGLRVRGRRVGGRL
ncbi:MAG: hypothetical protein ABDH20_10880 [Thermus sp.]